MSHLLWKYYWENDVDKFRRLLVPTGPNSQHASKSPALGHGGNVPQGGSPVAVGTSPRINNRQRKTSGYTSGPGKAKDAAFTMSRVELNSRDHAGLTVLLRAASSTKSSAKEFVRVLLEHSALDLYIQDPESGWNALHRALYSGNISIARMLLDRERLDLRSHTSGSVSKVGQLIKTKDHEGFSPFDLYNSTIASRSLQRPNNPRDPDADSDSDDSSQQNNCVH